MSNLVDRFRARRLLLIAAALAMVAAIACGVEAGASQIADPPAATENISTAGDVTADAAETAAATGGINQECVQQVLGREASGFGDITAAERDRIFSECSGGGSDAGDHTPRTGQFGQDHDSGDDSTFGGDGFRFRGGDGFGGQLPDCFTDALGERPDGFQGLSQEDFQAITEACGDELRSFGGDGQDGGGFFGRGGFRDGGFGGGLDLSSECVTNTLGHTVDSLQDLSAQERQQLFQTCFAGGAQ
jgi:hypothetical protein